MWSAPAEDGNSQAAQRGSAMPRRVIRVPRASRGEASAGPPDPDRTFRGARVHHPSALGDLDLAGGHESPGCRPGGFHQVAPALTAKIPGHLAGADRGVCRSLRQFRADVRAVAHSVPVTRPLLLPGDGATTRQALCKVNRFHADDPMIMRHACRQADECGVKVGAKAWPARRRPRCQRWNRVISRSLLRPTAR